MAGPLLSGSGPFALPCGRPHAFLTRGSETLVRRVALRTYSPSEPLLPVARRTASSVDRLERGLHIPVPGLRQDDARDCRARASCQFPDPVRGAELTPLLHPPIHNDGAAHLRAASMGPR